MNCLSHLKGFAKERKLIPTVDILQSWNQLRHH